MERQLYDAFAAVEHEHWWFVGYRRIIAKVLRSLNLPQLATILDVGCGNGGNLSMLSEFGEIYATEHDGEAAERAREKQIAKIVYRESLPGQCSMADQSCDLVVMLDVLEHIEDDLAALKILRTKLKDDGKLLVAVPAFMFLWSPHDVANHHYRRYTRAQLVELLQQAGFEVQYSSYFNLCLFPVALLARTVKRWTAGDGHDLSMPPKAVNRLLAWLFGSESAFLPRLSFPFGISLMATATK